MSRRFETLLLGAALAAPLPAAAGSVSTTAGPSLAHANAALALGGMDATSFSDFLIEMNGLMTLRDGEGLLPRDTLALDPAVHNATDPLVQALRERGISNPDGDLLAAAMPRAREIVDQREKKLAERLAAVQGNPAIGQHIDAIREMKDLAWVMWRFNSAYVPEKREDFKDLYISWGEQESRARIQRKEGTQARVSAAIGKADWRDIDSPIERGEYLADSTARYVKVSKPWHRQGLEPSLHEIRAANRRARVEREAAAAERRSKYLLLNPAAKSESDYPLSATREMYGQPLRERVDNHQPSEFWSDVSGAFTDFEARVDEILAWIPASDAGPKARILIIKNLGRQAAELKDQLLNMYHEPRGDSGEYKLGERGDGKNPILDRFKAVAAKIHGADLEHLTEVLRAGHPDRSSASIRAYIAFGDTLRGWIRRAPAGIQPDLAEILREGSRDPRIAGPEDLRSALRNLRRPGGPARTLLMRALGSAMAVVAIAAGEFLFIVSKVAGALGGPGIFMLFVAAAIALALSADFLWRMRTLWKLGRVGRWLDGQR